MVRAEAILSAVQCIAESALEPDGLSHAFPSIADAFRSQFVILFNRAVASGTVESIAGFGMAPEHLSGYAAVIGAGNAPPQMLSIPSGGVVRSSDLHSDREFARSVLYNEVVRPAGAFYATTVSLCRTPTRHTYFLVARRQDKEDYDRRDIAVMQKFVPHLLGAMRVRDRLATADIKAASAFATLDRLETGVVFVDAAGKIMFANRLAEKMLADNDCLANYERIFLSDSCTARHLRDLVAACAAGKSATGSALLARGSGRAPMEVRVSPLGPVEGMEMSWGGAARPVAMLLLVDPEREGRARKDDLRRRFGFTSAEANVALEMLKGDGRDAVAARLGVSMTTIRTHLSHIFEKTGVHRQAELVRLLLRDRR